MSNSQGRVKIDRKWPHLEILSFFLLGRSTPNCTVCVDKIKTNKYVLILIRLFGIVVVFYKTTDLLVDFWYDR